MADTKQPGGGQAAPEASRDRGQARTGGASPMETQGSGGALRMGADAAPEAGRRAGEASDEGVRRGERQAEAGRRAGEAADEGARRMGEGMEQGARRMGEGMEQGARRMGEGMEQGARRMGEGIEQGSSRMGEGIDESSRRMGEAGRQAVQGLGSVARRGAESLGRAAQDTTEAWGEGTQRGLHGVAEGQRRMLDDAAEEFAVTGQRLAEVVRETVEGMRGMMIAPGFSGESMRDAQNALSRLMDGMMATNMRLAHEMLRRSGPGAFMEIQQRALRDVFDAMTESGTVLLRVTRHAAEEQLRPLERQLRQRQQGNGHDRDAHTQGEGHDRGAHTPGEGHDRGAHTQGSGKQHREQRRVAEVMSRQVRLASPDDTVQQAARMMAETDAGALPVGENDRLVGMLTDRDLAMRVLAEARNPGQTRVRDVMTGGTMHYVFEDEPVGQVAQVMAQRQVRRLPVLNRQKRLVGIVSLGDVSGADEGRAGQAMHRIVGQGWERHHHA